MFIVLTTSCHSSLLECAPVISRQSSCYMLHFYAMLCSVNLTFYRQWRKFLRRDVYHAYHFLRQFSLGMFASYIEAVWGIHWLPNHTWLVDVFFLQCSAKQAWLVDGSSSPSVLAYLLHLRLFCPILLCQFCAAGCLGEVTVLILNVLQLLLFLMFNVPINRTLFSVDAN